MAFFGGVRSGRPWAWLSARDRAQLDGDLEQDGLRHHVVGDAERARLGRAHGLAGEAVVERDLQAGAHGEALQAVEAGQQAELHLGEAEDGLLVVGEDAGVAGQRDLEAAAERGAVHGGDDGLGRVGEALGGAVAGLDHGLALLGAW